MQGNPMQMMQQLSKFMNDYNGKNPEQEARQMIAQSGLDQKQLNALQSMANSLYSAGKQFGLFK